MIYAKSGENHPITSDEIFEQILNRIIQLRLEPGQLISENQMSAEYGVSRSVIRTAFTRLRQLGFIEIYPQRGTYVSLMDLSHIADLLMLRTAVEKEVLYEIFTELGEAERSQMLERLRENLKEQEKYRDEEDYFSRFPELDAEFHKIMIDSVNRSAMMQMLDSLMLHLSRWRNFDVAFDNRVPQLIAEHKKIFEAIEEGDIQKAQDRMGEHLETITAIADRATTKYPTYFKNG
ncbi:MAG: GntR family transcriptional regulator [Clostridiaceae bacterium]|nr:GntR family transcriptional regulator [Clostridiaceae bacterium]